MSYASINRVVLVGNLTRDPELRELPSGNSVCNLRIACNGIRRDAEGEYRERPLYFDVAVFGRLAESVARYMHRGSLVAVDGRLEWREWETAEQSKRQAVSVVAESVQFLDRPATHSEGDRSGGHSPPASIPRSTSRARAARRTTSASSWGPAPAARSTWCSSRRRAVKQVAGYRVAGAPRFFCVSRPAANAHTAPRAAQGRLSCLKARRHTRCPMAHRDMP